MDAFVGHCRLCLCSDEVDVHLFEVKKGYWQDISEMFRIRVKCIFPLIMPLASTSPLFPAQTHQGMADNSLPKLHSDRRRNEGVKGENRRESGEVGRGPEVGWFPGLDQWKCIPVEEEKCICNPEESIYGYVGYKTLRKGNKKAFQKRILSKDRWSIKWWRSAAGCPWRGRTPSKGSEKKCQERTFCKG